MDYCEYCKKTPTDFRTTKRHLWHHFQVQYYVSFEHASNAQHDLARKREDDIVNGLLNKEYTVDEAAKNLYDMYYTLITEGK